MLGSMHRPPRSIGYTTLVLPTYEIVTCLFIGSFRYKSVLNPTVISLDHVVFSFINLSVMNTDDSIVG